MEREREKDIEIALRERIENVELFNHLAIFARRRKNSTSTFPRNQKKKKSGMAGSGKTTLAARLGTYLSHASSGSASATTTSSSATTGSEGPTSSPLGTSCWGIWFEGPCHHLVQRPCILTHSPQSLHVGPTLHPLFPIWLLGGCSPAGPVPLSEIWRLPSHGTQAKPPFLGGILSLVGSLGTIMSR